MQINFHSLLWSYLSRVSIFLAMTVYFTFQQELLSETENEIFHRGWTKAYFFCHRKGWAFLLRFCNNFQMFILLKQTNKICYISAQTYYPPPPPTKKKNWNHDFLEQCFQELIPPDVHGQLQKCCFIMSNRMFAWHNPTNMRECWTSDKGGPNICLPDGWDFQVFDCCSLQIQKNLNVKIIKKKW